MIDVKKEKTTTISNAATIEEISDYWDVQSLSDHWDETRMVSSEIRAARRCRVTIDRRIFAQLEAEARARGVTPDTLANLWIAGHLRNRSVDSLFQAFARKFGGPTRKCRSKFAAFLGDRSSPRLRVKSQKRQDTRKYG
jgi:hypothetical protein